MPFVIAGISLVVFVIIVLAIAVAYFFNSALVRKPYRDYVNDPTYTGYLKKFHPEIAKGRKWINDNTDSIHTITSFDGTKLVGRYIKNGDSDRLIICFHGYHSEATHDFGIVAGQYFSMGNSLLIVDQRAHGASEGRYIGFGVLERRDCRAWVEYAVRTFGSDVQIWLDGISMGATTVMMASVLDLPENVRGIIADCGFTSPREIMTLVLRKSYHLPPFPLMNLIEPFAKRIAGFGFDEASTIDALKHNNIPIIFLHGTADRLVPCEMTERNFEAAIADKRKFIVEGAEHGTSYMEDKENCIEYLRDFLERTAK